MDIGGFIDLLRDLPGLPGVANPWACDVPGTDLPGAAGQRRAQLAAFLGTRAGARLVLVAEAPGYQGARFTGVPMTSERLLAGPMRAAVLGNTPFRRTSHPDTARNAPERRDGLAEPTATVVWQALAAAGIDRTAVLWNAFPLHPHHAGQPLTNRRPKGAELAATAHVLPRLLSLFPGARVMAVGRVARDRLAALGIDAVALRHPANGGVAAFRAGMRGVSEKCW